MIVRPEPGATSTVERAKKLGLDACAMPLFVIEAFGWQAPDADAFDGLLLTSASAVHYGGEQIDPFRGLPVHAVGKATAQAARGAGFTVASVGNGGVEQLLRSIAPDLRLLHLCGEHRIAFNAGQAVTSVPVYRSSELPVPGDLRAVAGQVAAIHSPRAGRRFAQLAVEAGIDRSTVRIAAISAAAAVAAGSGWDQVAVAATPDDRALLALAARLCDKPVTI
ncbi:MAG: uroporphyrinogen-III synthase [Sphingomicrobium sp.]